MLMESVTYLKIYRYKLISRNFYKKPYICMYQAYSGMWSECLFNPAMISVTHVKPIPMNSLTNNKNLISKKIGTINFSLGLEAISCYFSMFWLRSPDRRPNFFSALLKERTLITAKVNISALMDNKMVIGK